MNVYLTVKVTAFGTISEIIRANRNLEYSMKCYGDGEWVKLNDHRWRAPSYGKAAYPLADVIEIRLIRVQHGQA